MERPQLQNTECIDMHVQWQCQQAPYGGGYTDLNIVYQNFKKDCLYFNLFGVMYEQYILSIINKLIVQAESSSFENIVYVGVDSEIMVATNSNSSLHRVKFNSTNNLPLKLQRNFDSAFEDDADNAPPRDCAIPNKTRGFLFQE